MFELDDKFFEEVGITGMSVEELADFKKHVKDEIDIRVGERISDGIPVDRLAEFEKIIDGDKAFIGSWTTQNFPNYQQDQIFVALTEAGGQSLDDIMIEYASAKWLQVNRPDFAQVVTDVTNEMKAELKANAARISG